MRTLSILVALLAGCGSGSPADVAGNYTLAITNRDNGCNFMNWTVGEMATNIGFTVTQTAEGDVSGIVNGVVGTYLTLVVGSNVFNGTVSGNDLDLTLVGSRAYMQGQCTYTLRATARASLDGDFLAGTIDYTTATNGHADCGTLEGCHSLQDFNGTRPPPGPPPDAGP